MHRPPIVRTMLAVTAATLIAVGCGDGVPRKSICGVYGDGISRSDFEQAIDRARRVQAARKLPFPAAGTGERAALEQAIVDELIGRKLEEREADRADIEVSGREVDARLKEVQNVSFKGDSKGFDKELDSQGLTRDDLRYRIRGELLSEKLDERRSRESKVKVDDDDVRSYYRTNGDEFRLPASREVAVIVLADAREAARVHSRLVAGGSPSRSAFDKVAKAHLKDPRSEAAGKAFTAYRSEQSTAFDDVAFRLGVGRVSEPVKTDYGFVIIQARGATTAARKQSFDEARDGIRKQLEEAARSEELVQARARVRAKAADGNVTCQKRYVWSQTVKVPATTGPAPSTGAGTRTTGSSKASGS